jgi:hypothetical protein
VLFYSLCIDPFLEDLARFSCILIHIESLCSVRSIGHFRCAASIAFVAGIMVFICLDELLPVANSYGNEHPYKYGNNWGIFRDDDWNHFASIKVIS